MFKMWNFSSFLVLECIKVFKEIVLRMNELTLKTSLGRDGGEGEGQIDPPCGFSKKLYPRARESETNIILILS